MTARVTLTPTQDNGFVGLQVDGVDVTSALEGAVVHLSRNRVPVVQLALAAGEVDGELGAYLTGLGMPQADSDVAVGERIREDIIAELRQVDPQELEEGALARLGGLDGAALTQGAAFLAEFLERLR